MNAKARKEEKRRSKREALQTTTTKEDFLAIASFNYPYSPVFCHTILPPFIHFALFLLEHLPDLPGNLGMGYFRTQLPGQG